MLGQVDLAHPAAAELSTQAILVQQLCFVGLGAQGVDVCVPKIAVKAPSNRNSPSSLIFSRLAARIATSIELGMDHPQDPGNGHRRQCHRHDQLGRPPPVVGDEDRIGEDHRQHPEHAALDRGQHADRVVLANSAQHQDVLRGHEEDDDQARRARPRTSEAGGASASSGWRARPGSRAASPA